MNLTGHWKGNYVYGKEYQRSLVGKAEPFEFDIIDNNGSISGSCVDNIVRELAGNESYIIGSFINNIIEFKKRYKIHAAIDEDEKLVIDDEVQSDGVDYTGILKKKFFSRKYYFKGTWKINCYYKDQSGITQQFVCTGTWKMEKS